MSINESYQSGKMSVAAFLTVAFAVMLLINAPMITTNALAQDKRGGGQRAASPAKPPTGERKPPTGTGKPPTGERADATAPAAANGDSVPKPTGKNLSGKQKSNASELIKDLQDIKAGSAVTPDQVKALADSLMTLAQGTTKPNPATVDKLAADLADVISDGGVSKSDIKLVADDVQEVLNSANVPQSEIDAVIANAQAIFVASGINKG